ncbi:hypothetical protein LCGC14_0789580 [marine sediment metagenome]|uniref:Uncharacterized protein n=1 Tax=marine sediment metagenome TaxID=412755 RepID=A0A0F9PXA7_9ZZZZ
MRIGKIQKKILLYLSIINDTQKSLKDIITNIEEIQDYSHNVYEKYRTSLETLSRNKLVQKEKQPKKKESVFSLTQEGKKKSVEILSSYETNKQHINQSLKIMNLMKGYKDLTIFMNESFDNIIKTFNYDKIKDYPNIVKNEYYEIVGLLESFLAQQRKKFGVSIMFEIPRDYFCTKCEKQHHTSSNIGLEHREFKRIAYPLEEIGKIHKKFQEKKVTSKQAVVTIIDWMEFTEYNVSSFEVKMLIDKGIELIEDINPRIKEFYFFLEGMYFLDFIEKETIVNMIKGYFPKKYVKFLKLIENKP